MILLWCALLAPQDLWERSRTLGHSVDRGRPETRLGPLLDRSGGRIEAARVGFDLGLDNAFSCGRFDLKASFGSVLNKDVAGDLLGASLGRLRDQLAGSSMVLACQMSPTLCDAMKHFRVTANEVLGLQFAECRSIEEMAEGAARTLRARARHDCLAEQQAAGRPLDEALAACRAAPDLRGLTGRRQPEVDLVQELEEAFSLRPEARSILDELLDSTKVSAGGVRGDVKLRAVDAAYERTRADYERRLHEAVLSGGVDGLAPRTLPPIDPSDIDLLRAMDDVPRRNAVSVLAAAHALVDLTGLTHEIESLLEAAGAMADDVAIREALSMQSGRLRRETERLRETADISARALEARKTVQAAARADRDDKVRRGTAGLRYGHATRVREAKTRPWGGSCLEPFCPSKEDRR